MFNNLNQENVRGYCVGEPWNARAVAKDKGFTTLATQDIWLNHPGEGAGASTRRFATEKRDVLARRDEGRRSRPASGCDDPANVAEVAKTIGVEKYVNATPAEIEGRLGGNYDLGADLGTKTFGDDRMRFFRDGQVNVPRPGHAIWFMAQYVRFGYLKELPPTKELADKLILADLYAEVASSMGVTVPDDGMAPFTVKLDSTTFDPSQARARGETDHERRGDTTSARTPSLAVRRRVDRVDAPAADRRRPSAIPHPTAPRPPEPDRLRQPSPGSAVGTGRVRRARLASRLCGSSPAGGPRRCPAPRPRCRRSGELLGDAFEADGPAGKGIGLQLLDSLIRVFKGFAMAALVGIPLGFLIGTSRWATRMFNPVIQLLRPVSPLAWFPIWLTIMVKADTAAVWVIFITALWPVLLNTAAGAASVPDDQLDVARVFRFSRWGQLRGIVIPHACRR